MRMRHLTVAMAVAAAVACQPSTPPTGAQRSRIVTQVDSVISDLYQAMNAHDADAVMSHYLPGDTFLYVGVSDVLQGHEAYAGTMGPWYRAHPDVTFEYGILHTQVLSPTTATVTVKASTEESPYLTTTRTLVLQDGQWFIALEHESWPGAEVPGAGHPGTESP
jgi:uncharacterized protein (TIGR02246 family)